MENAVTIANRLHNTKMWPKIIFAHFDYVICQWTWLIIIQWAWLITIQVYIIQQYGIYCHLSAPLPHPSMSDYMPDFMRIFRAPYIIEVQTIRLVTGLSKVMWQEVPILVFGNFTGYKLINVHDFAI